MSDFIVEKLSKSVGDKTVFKDISFIIHDLDRIGLIGVNGTGKTTLLDVLSGVSGFDGDVSPFSAKNDYQIGYLTQDPDFDDSKTILDTVLSSDLKEIQLIREYELLMLNYSEDKQARLERVMAEMDSLQAWEIESQVKTVLSKLGIQDLSTPVGELSGGLRRRVQLAQVLLGNHDLLLLDEPTNHLDIATIEWLTLFLKNSKKTVLFITHDRYFLDALSTRIFELDRAGLTEYQGNYQDYVRLKAEQDERDAALLHKKEQLYKQELVWMRRQPQARATKQQARINRFHDLKKEVSGSSAETDLTMNFETSRIGKKVIEFQDVSFAYENKPILQDFNLLVQAKDRIGIVGDNGVGKSTLLNLIAGSLEPTEGQVVIGETVRIAYFSQQIEGLDESKRVINYLQEVAEEVKTSGGSTTSIAELLEQFLFPRSTHGTLIEKLSGGEKKRLYLLKLLLEKPNVLLLDEPTNGLDIQSITWLEDFLIDFDNTVIVVSHDRHFLNKVCTHMADLDFGKIKLYVGNYDFWKESSELAAKLLADRNAKAEEKIKQLQEFVARFSANASKSRQATSRKKMLDKIELEEIVPSSRKYPFINFKAEREIGNDLLTVENLTVKIDGETILDNISFILRPGDKTALIGQNDIQTTALIRAIMGDIDYEGTVKWGVTTSRSYLPKDNSADFAGGESILDWLRQFASKEEDDNTFLRGFLGRMLFSGDEVNKPVNVLSGGEKVRVMLSKLMLLKSNVLVLDDPTNHLDLESISSLNDGLKNFKESIIFASHDHEFIQTLANHIIVLSKNGVIDRIDETYDEFLENAEVQAKVKELWKD